MDRVPTQRLDSGALPDLLRASLVGAGSEAPDVFRMAWDGSDSEAKEIAVGCGGTADDVLALMNLWLLCDQPARATIARGAVFAALSEAAVAVVNAGAKRGREARHEKEVIKHLRIHPHIDT